MNKILSINEYTFIINDDGTIKEILRYKTKWPAGDELLHSGIVLWREEPESQETRDEFRKYAQEEVDFLKSLHPRNKRKDLVMNLLIAVGYAGLVYYALLLL